MLYSVVHRLATATLAFGVAGIPICSGQDVPSFAIRTIAGAEVVYNGQSLFRASLFGASRLTFDASGNLYISECSGNRIRKASQGQASTYAGTGVNGFSGDGGPAAAARLSCPGSLTFDSAGNLYFVDGSERIRRVTPDGVISTYVRPEDVLYQEKNGPRYSASALAANGADLYFTTGNQIRHVLPGGQVTTIAGGDTRGFSGEGGPAAGALLDGPSEIAFERGDLFVADTGNNRIRKITDDGMITTVAGTGQRGNTGDGGHAKDAQIASPQFITFDAEGNLLMTSSGQLRKVSPDGVIQTLNPYWSASDLAFNASDGYVYSVARGQVVAGKGDSTGIFIDGPRPPGSGLNAANANVLSPGVLAVDAAGNVFYVDSYFNSFTEVTFGGSVGVTGSGFVTAMALSPSGDLYYTVNTTQIRKLDRKQETAL